MKTIHLFLVLLLGPAWSANTMAQAPTKNYSHKVVVDSVIQTKIYTYLKVVERIGERDSLQWLALPLIESKAGDVFYFESGLPMGVFQSKELKRTFKQILFLSYVSTTAEVSEKSVLPFPIFDTTGLPQDLHPEVEVVVPHRHG